MPLTLLLLSIALSSLILLEIALRFLFGIGNPLIYVADDQIGYLLAPNQRIRRLNKRIYINQYSMRSPNITAERPTHTRRILVVGDSIANGGWWTDQEETISALLGRQLQAQQTGQPDPKPAIEVLNASANSWGPRNEFAYLHRFGTFQAQVIILILNTDDLFATAPTPLPVGRDLNYPDRKPLLAINDLIRRYWLKPSLDPQLVATQLEKGDRVAKNLNAILQIRDMASAHQGRFLLTMTPLLREVVGAGSRDYERTSRQRLLEFTRDQQMTYIDFLPIFKGIADPITLYRDHIHLSPQGNQLVSERIGQAIQADLFSSSLE